MEHLFLVESSRLDGDLLRIKDAAPAPRTAAALLGEDLAGVDLGRQRLQPGAAGSAVDLVVSPHTHQQGQQI